MVKGEIKMILFFLQSVRSIALVGASQSTTPEATRGANRTIDHFYHIIKEDCSSTDSILGSWLKVDLEDKVEIHSIKVIYARKKF